MKSKFADSVTYVSFTPSNGGHLTFSSAPDGLKVHYRRLQYIRVDPRIGPQLAPKSIDLERRQVLADETIAPAILLPDGLVVENSCSVIVARTLGLTEIPVIEVDLGNRYREPFRKLTDGRFEMRPWLRREVRRCVLHPRIKVNLPKSQPAATHTPSIVDGAHRYSVIKKLQV